jgi:lipopolysaccharide/colanic/teichoic acid biosynthesis glycosyltransferase
VNGAAKAISPAAGKSRQKTGLPGKWHFAAKRIFDVFWSVFGLTVFSPLMLLAAVLVGTTSPGGILFRQERVGKGGVPFTIYKFRTMRRDNAGLKITAGGDSRVTPVGRVLRKTKLDELPQFWNVLRGDMSFVGPRPEVKEYTDLYTPEQRRVLLVQPGITGPASIRYRDESSLLAGSSDPNRIYIEQIMPRKLELDLEYLPRAGVACDTRLIFQTLSAVLRG